MDKCMKTTQIKLLNLVWNVQKVDDHDRHLFLDDRQCYGTTSYTRQDIYIADNMSPEMTRETIGHELTHAALFSYSFIQKDEYTEEDVCEFVAKHGHTIDTLVDYLYSVLFAPGATEGTRYEGKQDTCI